MSWINEENIREYFDSMNLSIKQSGNGRWIDQKCTPDVLSIIADCIISFVELFPAIRVFTSLDIWHSEYAEKNIYNIFKKPNVENHAARNEYDKFFQQPMELLSYAKILTKIKNGNRNVYSISNRNILEYIAISERNSLKFLQIYIKKVLTDTGIYYCFDSFFSNPTPETFYDVKSVFTNTTKNYTKINGDTESHRIFTKVINPLAFEKNTEGTEKGRISKNPITYDMLMYNRDNFRDIYSSKPKGLTRGEHKINRVANTSYNSYAAYSSSKAKRFLRLFNDTFRNSKTEVDFDKISDKAIHMHHIFPESQFPTISGFYENLIALTPNQHFIEAHPNGQTSRIDRKYQYKCITCKLKNICQNLSSNYEDHIYSRKCFLKMLDVGLNTNEFENINTFNYDDIVNALKRYYPEVC